MKIQQQFHSHRCTMLDFNFMFVMNEQCNNDNNKIADACVHKIYLYVFYLNRTFYLRSVLIILSVVVIGVSSQKYDTKMAIWFFCGDHQRFFWSDHWCIMGVSLILLSFCHWSSLVYHLRNMIQKWRFGFLNNYYHYQIAYRNNKKSGIHDDFFNFVGSRPYIY